MYPDLGLPSILSKKLLNKDLSKRLLCTLTPKENSWFTLFILFQLFFLIQELCFAWHRTGFLAIRMTTFFVFCFRHCINFNTNQRGNANGWSNSKIVQQKYKENIHNNTDKIVLTQKHYVLGLIFFDPPLNSAFSFRLRIGGMDPILFL